MFFPIDQFFIGGYPMLDFEGSCIYWKLNLAVLPRSPVPLSLDWTALSRHGGLKESGVQRGSLAFGAQQRVLGFALKLHTQSITAMIKPATLLSTPEARCQLQNNLQITCMYLTRSPHLRVVHDICHSEIRWTETHISCQARQARH